MGADAQSRALAAGKRAYGEQWRPSMVARAPGRLELLGNHVDYNGGKVLAATIDRDVVCLSDQGGDIGEISVVFADSTSPDAARVNSAQLRDWRIGDSEPQPADYLRGVVATAIGRGVRVRDRVQLVVAGDVPIGFGLSSSAALCVSLTLALHVDEPAPKELVLRAQEAEHRAGTPCGTMDQSASVGGDVILFDGASLSFVHLQPDLGDYVFAVADSGVSRSLSSSSYPARVEESRRVVAEISRVLGREIGSLASVTAQDLDAVAPTLDPILLKRARHIATEVDRVGRGVAALQANDWPAFGELMNASGRSSDMDYEISHPLVEELVAEARGVPGVVGARMMGGGGGGTALILLKRAAFPRLVERLNEGYYQRNGLGVAETRVLIQAFGSGAASGAFSPNRF